MVGGRAGRCWQRWFGVGRLCVRARVRELLIEIEVGLQLGLESELELERGLELEIEKIWTCLF